MENLLENLKSGWVLSVIRSEPKNIWFFVPSEEAESSGFSMSGKSPVEFYKIRPLLKHCRVAYNSSEYNDMGLPLVSLFVHKSLEISD